MGICSLFFNFTAIIGFKKQTLEKLIAGDGEGESFLKLQTFRKVSKKVKFMF